MELDKCRLRGVSNFEAALRLLEHFCIIASPDWFLKANISFVFSVRLSVISSVWNNSAPTRRISIKRDILPFL
jgi:hypothetical protein